MTDTPVISILVPCYNVEKYLNQCMDSILNQTYRNLEIICLNDGSTDGTRKILEEYAALDKRIIVVNKANSGYGATMNTGLRMAKGKYVGIVESDDYIEPTMFETLCDNAEKNRLDTVKCLYSEHYEDTGKNKVRTYKFIRYNEVMNPSEEQKVFGLPPAIWAGLYNREFLVKNNIDFLETPGASFQDTAFAFKVYASAERVMFIPEILHHYRINPGSSVKSPDKVFFVCDEEAEIRRYAKAIGKYGQLKEIMALRAFSTYKWNYKRLGSLKLKRLFLKRWSAEARLFFEEGSATRRYFSKNRLLRLRLIAYCPWIYYFSKKI